MATQRKASAVLSSTIEAALSPGHFFLARPARLRREYLQEAVPWEIFRGHLLDAARTREWRQFDSWHVFIDESEHPSATPLVSVRVDCEQNHLYVTRQILTYAHEAYEESPGVIQTREVEKWLSELVAAIELADLAADELKAELKTAVFLAVIGTSRLPITSLESPLPGFSLGQLGYAPSLRGDAAYSNALEFLAAVIDRSSNVLEQTKALETTLRSISTSDLSKLAKLLERQALSRNGSEWFVTLCRTLFNHVALSPYTQFADRLIALLLLLGKSPEIGGEPIVDLVSYMLRQLTRHLTAFDLTLFHNFGANYPDALFLDALLKAYLQLLDEHASWFVDARDDSSGDARSKRLRRRALRQAALVRKQYEGHRVPDAPTSMGENARVLPAPFERVPQEQIVDRGRRSRALFESEPLESSLGPRGQQLLQQCLADLGNAAELRELGTAVFLARPLGAFKQPGEPDRTPLVSCEAFSRSVAKRRLAQLKALGWMSADERARLIASIDELNVPGRPATEARSTDNPGVVSLADAQRVASDFVLMRSSRHSVDDLLGHYAFKPLADRFPRVAAWLESNEPRLLLQEPPASDNSRAMPLRLYDRQGRLRIEFALSRARDSSNVYRTIGGIELLRALLVLRVFEPIDHDRLIEHTFQNEPIVCPLRGRATRKER